MASKHHFDAGCEECRLRARGYVDPALTPTGLRARPAPDTLDVERLAYALNRAFGLQTVGGPLNEIGANPMKAAERLAREYAGVTLDPQPEGCGECMGWPGHHPGCSKYGIPRTEAGARLLVMLENIIYRGGTIGDVARIDIVSIEDEAEVRAANRAALRSTPAAPQPDTALTGHQTRGEFHDYRVACVKCGEPGFLHVSWRPEKAPETDALTFATTEEADHE